jgi:hypothetical protein
MEAALEGADARMEPGKLLLQSCPSAGGREPLGSEGARWQGSWGFLLATQTRRPTDQIERLGTDVRTVEVNSYRDKAALRGSGHCVLQRVRRLAERHWFVRNQRPPRNGGPSPDGPVSLTVRRLDAAS